MGHTSPGSFDAKRLINLSIICLRIIPKLSIKDTLFKYNLIITKIVAWIESESYDNNSTNKKDRSPTTS
jgi:hypothetical protein